MEKSIFDIPLCELEKFQTGEPILKDKLNAPIEFLNRAFSGVNPPQQTGVTPRNQAIQGVIFQCKIVSIYPDSLLVIEFDGTNVIGDTKFEVAKPYLLRRSPFDGKARDGVSYFYNSNVSRNAYTGLLHEVNGTVVTEGGTPVADSEKEIQIVIPTYVVNDVIFVAQKVGNGTGVQNGTDKIKYLDMNVDGRAWAKQDE